MQNQLRWSGHCIWKSDNRVPRQVLFEQLIHDTRTRGGQRKRFKDTGKHYRKKHQIDINAWELMAADRPLSRQSIYQATAKFETNRLLHEAEKRQRGKEREMSQHVHVSFPSGISCPHCNKIYKSTMGLLSHLMTHDRIQQDVIIVSRNRWWLSLTGEFRWLK